MVHGGDRLGCTDDIVGQDSPTTGGRIRLHARRKKVDNPSDIPESGDKRERAPSGDRTAPDGRAHASASSDLDHPVSKPVHGGLEDGPGPMVQPHSTG